MDRMKLEQLSEEEMLQIKGGEGVWVYIDGKWIYVNNNDLGGEDDEII